MSEIKLAQPSIMWEWHEWQHGVQITKVGRLRGEVGRGGTWYVLEGGDVIASGEESGTGEATKKVVDKILERCKELDAAGVVPEAKYRPGQQVYKGVGDYRFAGVVVSAFRKLSGNVRYVVENADGILHIFSESQLSEVT